MLSAEETVRDFSELPRLRGIPLLANNVGFFRDARRMVLRGQAQHGDAFRFSALGSNGIFVLDPRAIRDVFVDRDQAFSSERAWRNTAGRMFQGGLMLRDFEDHRLHRRAMQHAFRRAALSEYMDKINRLAREHVARAGSEVDVYRMTKRLTLDIASNVFVGLEFGSQSALVDRCFASMMKATISPIWRPLPGSAMARGIRSRERLVALLTELVNDRRNRPPQSDLLSQLAHAPGPTGEPMATDAVVMHLLFLLMAAHDTTSSTLTVMIWHLANEPEWQERVASELIDLGGQDVTIDNHAGLINTEMVMKEALRLHPPTPFVPREAVREVTVGDVRVAPGVVVSVPVVAVHRHPDWWQRPDDFDPTRFSSERAEDKGHSHLFIPFGGGAHICLGLHLAELIVKAVLAALLAEHRLVKTPGDRLDMGIIPLAKPRKPVLLTTLPRSVITG